MLLDRCHDLRDLGAVERVLLKLVAQRVQVRPIVVVLSDSLMKLLGEEAGEHVERNVSEVAIELFRDLVDLWLVREQLDRDALVDLVHDVDALRVEHLLDTLADVAALRVVEENLRRLDQRVLVLDEVEELLRCDRPDLSRDDRTARSRVERQVGRPGSLEVVAHLLPVGGAGEHLAGVSSARVVHERAHGGQELDHERFPLRLLGVLDERAELVRHVHEAEALADRMILLDFVDEVRTVGRVHRRNDDHVAVQVELVKPAVVRQREERIDQLLVTAVELVEEQHRDAVLFCVPVDLKQNLRRKEPVRGTILVEERHRDVFRAHVPEVEDRAGPLVGLGPLMYDRRLADARLSDQAHCRTRIGVLEESQDVRDLADRSRGDSQLVPRGVVPMTFFADLAHSFTFCQNSWTIP